MPPSLERISVQENGEDKDGLFDPADPRTWPSKWKWINILLISMQGTLSPIASTILVMGTTQLMSDFSLTNTYVAALPIGLYVLGLGIGPLFVAPCSEVYGRRVAYVVSFCLFTVLNVGCALSPNVGALIVLRLLSGMAGSAGPSLGGSSVGDMFRPEERGKAQAVYSLGPTFGPVLGGVIGGFIVHGTGGWRWLLWVMAIASGVTSVAAILVQRETYQPFLLRQKQRCEGAVAQPRAHIELLKVLRVALTRPVRLLFTSPICTFMSLYLSLIYGILYLHLITIPLLYGPTSIPPLFSYRWTGGTTGLAFLGAGIGSLFGTAVCARFLNRSYARAARHHAVKSGQHDTTAPIRMPEFRLPFLQAGMLIVPAGLIIFGWSAEEQTHWVVPLVGACVLGMGMLMGYVAIHAYLVDAFEQYAASALAAAVITRCVLTCVLTVVGSELYRRLGYAW
ncbi:MFS general substrate transporter [Aspergillus japonicus CBS 114.51]|uniref:MFS general substrate transporter n=1 Tax=Aspergillus japonicus CBS 114.51 TaxID=1448312 RepID=A0A8T8WL92_ASPJA|nr:MFS general substrate transporter [Aspergillus japonicus CBS 114.51]RAH76537.1 MFS general substrate transporter [Aspergillus japonicus CBS 114.51]